MVPILELTSLLLVLAFAGLLVHAAVQDCRRFLISNRTVLGVAALFTLFIAAQWALPEGSRMIPAPFDHLWKGLLLSLVVFAAAAALFALNVMGGGDVKLLAAITLWAGPAWTAPFILVTAIAGGIVTLGLLLMAAIAPKSAIAAPAASPNLNPLRSRMQNVKVPYGLGISAGGLAVAWFLATRADLFSAT